MFNIGFFKLLKTAKFAEEIPIWTQFSVPIWLNFEVYNLNKLECRMPSFVLLLWVLTSSSVSFGLRPILLFIYEQPIGCNSPSATLFERADQTFLSSRSV